MPPEVEVGGLDTIEFAPDIYLPESAKVPEMMVEPDGAIVPAEGIVSPRRLKEREAEEAACRC